MPPEIQVLVWLLSNNKLMTVDNLEKWRGMSNKPKNCRFCSEDETINRLFFQCVVAKTVWGYFEQFTDIHIDSYLTWLANGWMVKNYVLLTACYGRPSIRAKKAQR